MAETILTAITAFLGTNIDDIFINTLFFAQADSKGKMKAVITGKYLAMSALVLLSLTAALILKTVPKLFTGLIGLIPIALGIKEWVNNIKSKDDSEEENTDISKGLLFSTAFITVANGSDNIGVYIPLFASFTATQTVIAAVIFIIMTAVWCYLGKKLSDLPGLRNFLLKYKQIIVPAVYIILGIYIMLKSIL